MGSDLSSAPPYSGPRDVSYTSVQEAEAGKGAENQAAPAGTTAVPVESGDTISGLMSRSEPPLDYGNDDHRRQFLQDNPQFITREDVQQFPELASQFDPESGRNPDLIWPGEVVYVRSSPTPETGGEPPLNGTQAVSGPDADGNYAYQNYVNGQPNGSQYSAKPGTAGQPADSVIIGENGGEIRTGANGAPLTGWAPVGEVAQSGESTYVYYVNGMPTTESTTRGMTEGPPTEPPAPATGNDQAGNSLATDGWKVTAGSSQGVAQHYYVDGYRIDSNQVVNGRADGPPPIIPPGTNAQLGEDRAPAPSEESTPPVESTPAQRPTANPVDMGPHDTSTLQGATDAAASNYYDMGHPPYSGETIENAEQRFVTAVQAELDSGQSTVDDIKARYGNDPWMNRVIDEAAASR